MKPETTPRQPKVPILQIENTFFYAVSQSGRPIAEMNAEEETIAQAKRDGVGFQQRNNHLQDSRGVFPNKKINASAYIETNLHQQEVADGFAWVNNLIFDTPPQQISPEQLRALATIPYALPGYLIYRNTNPLSYDNLPTVVGDMFKTAFGFQLVANDLIRRKKDEVITPAKVYGLANETKGKIKSLLVGGERVCPAPEAIITRISDALITGNGGDAQRSELNTLIPPQEYMRLYQFSQAFVAYEDFTEQKRARIEHILIESTMAEDIAVNAHRLAFVIFAPQIKNFETRLNKELGRSIL